LVGKATADPENTLFEEAAVQGQTIVAAAGDQGSEDCLGSSPGDGLAVDDPASQPFVTGVGGTSWTASGSPPTETAWNDGAKADCCWGAGGGGVSELWAMPSYQADSTAVGVINDHSSGKSCGAHTGSYCRQVPDVSALAGPYPYLDYVSGTWGSWGGTSLAAPLWASLIALADASATCSGKDIGFANPILYQVAAADPTAFNDVTVGNNDLSGKHKGLYPATVGYDMATGLGTPDVAALPEQLCAGAAVDPVSVTDPGGQRTDVDTAVSLQVAASDANTGQRLTYRAIGLPPGVGINSATGLIHGTPSAPGSYDSLVTVRAGDGASASVAFPWAVDLAITSASAATATIGDSFSFTVRTTGVPRTFTVSPKPPAGLRLKNLRNGTATLSGTPSRRLAAGRYPLVFEADFGTKKVPDPVSQAFTLTLVK
jgi:kumamolisin